MLALTHLSSRYAGRELREEARARVRGHEAAARLRHDRGALPRAWGRQLIRWPTVRQTREAGAEAIATR